MTGKDWIAFPEVNAIHLNDTQTALAPIELLRILLDVENLQWDEAWYIVRHACTFTSHSIHGARDKWPCDLLNKILPRHLDLIFKINYGLIEELKLKGCDSHTLSEVSLVEEWPKKMIRFSNVCFVCSNVVNGLSDLHVTQLKTQKFKCLNEEFPDKIISIQCGVSPRRWIKCSNPAFY